MKHFDGPEHHSRVSLTHPNDFARFDDFALSNEGKTEYVERMASLDYEVLKETATFILELRERMKTMEDKNGIEPKPIILNRAQSKSSMGSDSGSSSCDSRTELSPGPTDLLHENNH